MISTQSHACSLGAICALQMAQPAYVLWRTNRMVMARMQSLEGASLLPGSRAQDGNFACGAAYLSHC